MANYEGSSADVVHGRCVKKLRENRILCSSDVAYQELEDQDQGMVPAALPAIRSLGATRIQVEDGKNVHHQCIVCQEEYCNGEKVTCMPCLHMFHTDCITKWLLRSHVCPICKFQMPKYSCRRTRTLLD